MTGDTRKIYNEAAGSWVRREPQSLSDFTGRPAVFKLCGDVAGQAILDVGCGEGYCSRVLIEKGAGSVRAIDISESMTALAAEASPPGFDAEYQVGSATELPFEDNAFDLAIGVFVYNYLDIAGMNASMKEVYRTLKPGGRFVFSVPHPAFPFIQKQRQPPFYFDLKEAGYFTGRDQKHDGEIHRRDGAALPVQVSHKLLGDYFEGLRLAGFDSLPEVQELGVLPEHLELDREFFSPVWDIPLHIAFRIRKRESE